MEHPDSQKSETTEPIDTKLDRGDYVEGLTPHTNFGISILKGGGSTHAWNCHHPCLFFTPRYFFVSCAPVEIAPFDRFSCFMAQKTCFHDSYVLFWVQTKFSTIFRKKKRNSLFPQCKTSIGNNSGSIKDRDVKFAYNKGFSATANRMVWPSSLSRDRKWPH